MRAIIVLLISLLVSCQQLDRQWSRYASSEPTVSAQLAGGYKDLAWGLGVKSARPIANALGRVSDTKSNDPFHNVVPFTSQSHLVSLDYEVSPWFWNDSLFAVKVFYSIDYRVKFLKPHLFTDEFQIVENLLMAEFGRPLEMRKIAPTTTLTAVQRIALGEGDWFSRWLTPDTEIKLELSCSTCSGNVLGLSLTEDWQSRYLWPSLSSPALHDIAGRITSGM